MPADFAQINWDERTEDACRHLVRLAVREDLDRGHDWTTLALVPEDAQGAAKLVVRSPGVVAGLPAARVAIDEMELPIRWTEHAADGDQVDAGTPIASVAGSARHLLTSERILLNFLGRLSGVATLTNKFVRALEGSGAEVYDTRKTTPGWRLLEKYAVRCGGGHNHRTGLFDAILIKDNHLPLAAGLEGQSKKTAGEAVLTAREFVDNAELKSGTGEKLVVEVEVDTLEQLREVLPVGPDIVLLDNMSRDELSTAVQLRNEINAQVVLEASGGINLDTVRSIADSGVDRISVGSLTHSTASLDIGLDWHQSG